MSSRNVSHRGRPPERHRDRPRHRQRHPERQVDVLRGNPQNYAQPVQGKVPVTLAKAPVRASKVMVVSVIGRSYSGTSQLLDRLLDNDVFASGRAKRGMPRGVDKLDHARRHADRDTNDDWTAGLIQHFYDEESGTLYISLVCGLSADLIRQLSNLPNKDSQAVSEKLDLQQKQVGSEGREMATEGSSDQSQDKPGLQLGKGRGGKGGGEGITGMEDLQIKNEPGVPEQAGEGVGQGASTAVEVSAGIGDRKGRAAPKLGEGGERLSSNMSEPVDVLEQHETDSMQAMLLVFCVSHTVILMQDHARFNPQLLRTFRILQGCKTSLLPNLRPKPLPALLPQPTPSSRGEANQRLPSDGLQTKAAGRLIQGQMPGILGVSSSEASSGSPVLLPGQVSPTLLFVYDDEYAVSATNPQATADPFEGQPSASAAPAVRQVSILGAAGESSGSGLLNSGAVDKLRGQRVLHSGSAGSIGWQKSSLPSSRQSSALAATLRKKAQSSLESQIRFLIKKCRTTGNTDVAQSLAGGGGRYAPLSRGAPSPRTSSTVTTGSPLFVLDASRVVVFLDRNANQPGAVLESVSDTLDDIFDTTEDWERQGSLGDDNLDALDVGSNAGDDIVAIREFISKQDDNLRHRGGSLAAGFSGIGGPSGAAPTSSGVRGSLPRDRASGKGFTSGSSVVVELPSFDSWVTSCQALYELLTSKAIRDQLRAPRAVTALALGASRQAGVLEVEGSASGASVARRDVDRVTPIVHIQGRGIRRLSQGGSSQDPTMVRNNKTGK